MFELRPISIIHRSFTFSSFPLNSQSPISVNLYVSSKLSNESRSSEIRISTSYSLHALWILAVVFKTSPVNIISFFTIPISPVVTFP
jgi:hypothetical protein